MSLITQLDTFTLAVVEHTLRIDNPALIGACAGVDESKVFAVSNGVSGRLITFHPDVCNAEVGMAVDKSILMVAAMAAGTFSDHYFVALPVFFGETNQPLNNPHNKLYIMCCGIGPGRCTAGGFWFYRDKHGKSYTIYSTEVLDEALKLFPILAHRFPRADEVSPEYYQALDECVSAGKAKVT